MEDLRPFLLMASEKFQFPYLQERLVWDNLPNIVFAANTLRGLSLKMSAVAGNENPGQLHEDAGSCFYCSGSDAQDNSLGLKRYTRN